VLAQSAIVIWGTCEIDWDTLGAAINIIRSDPILHSFLESRMLQNAFFMQHLRRLHRSPCNELDNDENELKKHPFLHLLDIARSFDVTEPRDKVYGLLGFPMRDVTLETSVFVVPDYTKSVGEVYTETAWKMVRADGHLNILSFVVRGGEGDQEEHEGVPSWVPNWTCKDVAYPMIGYKPENQHCAGTWRPMEIIDTGDPMALCIKGVVVDAVRSAGGRIPFTDFNNADVVLQELVDWCLLERVEASTLAHTLTAGRNAAGHLIVGQGQHIADMFAFLSHFGVNGATNLCYKTGSPRELDERSGSITRGKEAVWRYCSHRKAFRTEKGMLGLGPGGVKVGDAVVVLWGGQMPFVLREVAGENGKVIWHFVGEAYVHGVVEESDVEALIEEGYVERAFEIR
jgi:hypothetical protein